MNLFKIIKNSLIATTLSFGASGALASAYNYNFANNCKGDLCKGYEVATGYTARGQMARAARNRSRYKKKNKEHLSVFDYAKSFSQMIELADVTGAGVGLTAGLSAYVGGSLTMELTHIKPGTWAFYCAPGISASPNIGPSLGVSFIKIYGCYDNEDYTGNFLTLGFGPFSHSWGASLDHFLSNLEYKAEIGEFFPQWLPSEVTDYIGYKLMKGFSGSKSDTTVLNFACDTIKMMSLTNQDIKYPKNCQDLPKRSGQSFGLSSLKSFFTNPEAIAEKFDDLESLSDEFKRQMERSSERNLFPNLYAFVESLDGTFSGCNSVTAGVDVLGLVKNGVKKGAKEILKNQIKRNPTLKSILGAPSFSLTHYAKFGEIDFNLSDEDVANINALATVAPEGATRAMTLAEAEKEVGGKLSGSVKAGFRLVKNMVAGCWDSTQWVAKDTARMVNVLTGTGSYDHDIDLSKVDLDLE